MPQIIKIVGSSPRNVPVDASPGTVKRPYSLKIPGSDIKRPAAIATGIAGISIFPSFNYAKYKETIEKFRALDIETIAFSHFGVTIGKDVKKNLDNSLAAHRELEKIVEDYTNRQDKMKLIQDLKNELEEATEIFPAPVREVVAEFMARGFLKGMNES